MIRTIYYHVSQVNSALLTATFAVAGVMVVSIGEYAL